MQTPSEYLQKTESAARLLFKGIDDYVSVLRETTTFATSYENLDDFQHQWEVWLRDNPGVLERNREFEDQFLSEKVALDVLCGAVLQIALKPIEMFMPEVTSVAAPWTRLVTKARRRMLRGREVNGVPLGLLIYAARNQHTHFEDGSFVEPTPTVFNTIATVSGYSGLNPSFDLAVHQGQSLAANVTALIGWRSYKSYIEDMRNVLEVT